MIDKKQESVKHDTDSGDDLYEKALESIGKTLLMQSKMVLWIAERILSAKDFKEFARHEELWRYEQAINEITELLKNRSVT